MMVGIWRMLISTSSKQNNCSKTCQKGSMKHRGCQSRLDHTFSSILNHFSHLQYFFTVVPHLERVFLRILITVLCSRKKGTCKSRLPNHIVSNLLNPHVYLRFNICIQVPLTCKSLCTLCAYHLSPFRHWCVDNTKEIISLMMHIKLIFFCN